MPNPKGYNTVVSLPTLLPKRWPIAATAAKRLVLAGIGFSGAAMIGAGIMVAAPGSSSHAHTAPAIYAPDIDGLLDARSPGSRRNGWLVNTKPERIAYVPDDPVERVLSSVRRRPPLTITLGAIPLIGSPILPDGFASPTEPASDAILAGKPSPASGIGGLAGPVAGGGILPGIGGGVGGDASMSGQNPLMSAVPEPTAWSLMFLGFGLLGVVLRQRRSLHLASDPQ